MIGDAGAAFPGVAPSTTCSRAGCSEAAVAAVNWRNPRIHSPERVKVWLACDAHVDYLRDFLFARDFPVRVTPLGVSVDRVEEP